MEQFFYKVNDTDYLVEVIHKPIKNIHYRFKDGHFVVTCPRGISKRNIIKGLDKFGENLIKRSIKPIPLSNDYIYLFGEKVALEESGEIKFTGDEVIKYKSQEDLLKKLRRFFLKILKSRVEYYASIMKLPLYKVSVKNMKTRFGSNSKHTKSLHFAFVLIHYSYPIIDSVIIHELAHIKEYNHSKSFYDIVYKYCPDYDLYRKKLIKGEYK